jgi:hypothetical protein
MRADRKSAIWIGVLYIVATVFPASSAVPWSTLTDGEGVLANAASHQGALIAWALLVLAMAMAVAGIAVMFYPILMRVADTSVEKGLALWYVGTRITEGTVFFVTVLAGLTFLPLSREFAAAGSPADSHFQTDGVLLQWTSDLTLVLGQSVFALGALMLYYLLFAAGLVPRWLSLWGLVAAPLFLVASLSFLWTGESNSTVVNLLMAPILLQEMVMAVWLIVKGFEAAAFAPHVEPAELAEAR